MKKIILALVVLCFSFGIANARISTSERESINAQIAFKVFEKELHKYYVIEQDLRATKSNSKKGIKANFFYNDIYTHLPQKHYKWLVSNSKTFRGSKNWEVVYHRWLIGSTGKTPSKIAIGLINATAYKTR